MAHDSEISALKYESWPALGRTELIRGRVYDRPLPGWVHGTTAQKIAFALEKFVRDKRVGAVFPEVGYITQCRPDSVRGPDVSFVSSARMAVHPDDAAWFEGGPEIAVEVVSPSNSHRGLLAKAAEYQASGTTLVWIVDPQRKRVQVVGEGGKVTFLGESDTLRGDPVLPGFELPLGDLFGSG